MNKKPPLRCSSTSICRLRDASARRACCSAGRIISRALQAEGVGERRRRERATASSRSPTHLRWPRKGATPARRRISPRAASGARRRSSPTETYCGEDALTAAGGCVVLLCEPPPPPSPLPYLTGEIAWCSDLMPTRFTMSTFDIFRQAYPQRD